MSRKTVDLSTWVRFITEHRGPWDFYSVNYRVFGIISHREPIR